MALPQEAVDPHALGQPHRSLGFRDRLCHAPDHLKVVGENPGDARPTSRVAQGFSQDTGLADRPIDLLEIANDLKGVSANVVQREGLLLDSSIVRKVGECAESSVDVFSSLACSKLSQGACRRLARVKHRLAPVVRA